MHHEDLVSAISMTNFYLQVIDTLCTECASLIENHEKIQVLSAVHYNLGKTLLDVENIVALPQEAGSAEANAQRRCTIDAGNFNESMGPSDTI